MVLVIILVLSLAANAVLAIMLIKARNQSPSGTETTPGTQPSAAETVQTTAAPQENEIPTRYITLEIPEDLQEVFTVKTTEAEGSTQVTFSGVIEGQELHLFAFVFTKEETGDYILGVLTDEAEGNINVVMNMNEQNPEDWSDETYKEIGALQERVNDFILQFYEDPRFTPSQPAP